MSMQLSEENPLLPKDPYERSLAPGLVLAKIHNRRKGSISDAFTTPYPPANRKARHACICSNSKPPLQSLHPDLIKTMSEVKLYGFWPSPFSQRIIWALKLKGVEYEYIEEDLSNKSESLLKYNPVHKKIPVLIHGDKPIAESLVILEYIEETWPENPLLPKDPYERAMARFWIQYGVDTVAALGALTFYQGSGEELKKAAKELLESLKILEEQGLGDKKFFGGESMNLVDISYGALGYWLAAVEEAKGVKVLEPSTLPRLHAWAKNLNELPVVKENIPASDKILAFVTGAMNRLAKN
ncbi:hypothetical protein SADUNF_Sadunf10G0046400 [Salix dunnii]|uniref:glutathione transferase n=1 Tax=Salix dunnii TaxID=1413687 RepID=A0A835JS96_9ROSI|nr:hypothetical protein SADUNF_Sadunf10G0046400 [Salix dunnii]